MTQRITPVDQPERDRIRDDLDTNLLVEAGAGSGKTTALVARVLTHVRRGTPMEQIAAVTFTRKAATELRERLEEQLDAELAAAPAGEEADRLARARGDLDRAFIGTIHAFCGRLLREHPLEAGLDPTFEEIGEDQWPVIRKDFWHRWLERCAADADPALARLREIGVDPRSLFTGFEQLVRYPDVEFPTGDTAAPDPSSCHTALERLLAAADELTPRAEPESGWDALQQLVRLLRFLQRTTDWSRLPAFCQALARMTTSSCKVTQNRWSDAAEGKKRAKQLGEEFLAFVEGPAAALLTAWREHRYPRVMEFCTRAAAEFRRERLATGRLGFEDLLLGAASLLREHPAVRRALGTRFRHLLVDEFQDTDPVQAEVCFLLASEPEEGNEWRLVRPRPGALFVVGDPKQSIYRFRRADVQTYDLVKRRFAECGEVLRLVQNFRSVDRIGAFVDEQFTGVFPEEASPEQASFAPLRTCDPGGPADGVFRYAVTPDAGRRESVGADCAARAASWIARRVAAGERRPGDFLILTWQKKELAAYARALAERNVPVSVTGAGLTQEEELRELILLLQALADPANPVLVAAALEGLFFGCSPADLYEGRTHGLDFAITHRPSDEGSPCGRALARLHEWWIASQRLTADLLLERILDDSGLVLYAASRELGENRAGALLRLVELLRNAGADGGSLGEAVETIQALLDGAETDAPLRPGQTDVVRVMNVHKAKGLEAPVVVLGAPVKVSVHDVQAHVRRDASGAAQGGLVISDDADEIIAQPPGWADMAEAEARLLAAERDRLRYVAVTRAQRELVVAQLVLPKKADESAWAAFAEVLARHAPEPLDLAIEQAPGRDRLTLTVEELRARTEQAERRRVAGAAPSWTRSTVTQSASQSAREEREDVKAYEPGSRPGLGAAWGRAVHRVLEAAGRGRAGEGLERFARAVALDEQLVADGDAAGTAARLVAIVAEVRATDAWKQLETAETAWFELPMMRIVELDGTRQLLEGVADAVAHSGDRWTVVDWKTDKAGRDEWEQRRKKYDAQVTAYGATLAALGGGEGQGTIVRVGLEPDGR